MDYLYNDNFTLETSDIKDAHLQEILDKISEVTGIDKATYEKQIGEYIQQTTEKLKTRKFSKDATLNLAESQVFFLLEEVMTNPNYKEKFSEVFEPEKLFTISHFSRLWRCVLGANREFSPLTNGFENRTVRPVAYVVPDQLFGIEDENLKAEAAKCETAFCTTKALMVFNKEFCQRLCLFASIKKPKNKPKFYESNGGRVPDHYCYIEFLMIHELMHYSAGDHFFAKDMVDYISKKYPKLAGNAHNVINIVGDYANNWTILRMGKPQLPVGLFSAQVNMSKQKTYNELIDVVCAEMETMDDDDINDVMNELSKAGDEHMENDKNERLDDNNKGGSNQPNPKKEPESSDGSGGSDGGDAEGSESSDGSGGSDLFSNRTEGAKKNEKIASETDNELQKAVIRSPSDSSSGSESGDNATKEKGYFPTPVAKINPIGWRLILTKLVPTGEGEEYETYSRPSRQMASMMASIALTGQGAIKRGIRQGDPIKKSLMFVIDNSGSVSDSVSAMYRHITNLLANYHRGLENIYIIKFDTNWNLYEIFMERGNIRYKKIVDEKSVFTGKAMYADNKTLYAKELLTTSSSEDSIFSKSMYEFIAKMLKTRDMNVMVFTDSDLYEDETYKEFTKLAKQKYKRQVGIFYSTKDDFERMTKWHGYFNRLITFVKAD